MLTLMFLMLQRCGLIILLAYLLMNVQRFRAMLSNRSSKRVKIFLIMIFGLFAIISNFSGVEVSQNQIIADQLFSRLQPGSSLANTRVLTIGVSGMIGGPLVGTTVGIFSGIIRFLQGGVDAHTYIISSVLVGILSGNYGQKWIRKKVFPPVQEGFFLGMIMEIVQMFCILLFGSNLREAWDLVLFVGLPMIVVNSIGSAIFLSIIETTLSQEEMAKAVQTHDVLQLANETLPYFRTGLNQKSSTEAAKIIQRFIKVSAVSITDQQQILAHVGVGSDHHKSLSDILTGLSKEVLADGKTREAHSREQIGCDHLGCPLEAAIVIPLKSRQQVIGTLKMYFTDTKDLTFVERQLAEGLGNIFSSQIELGEMETEGKLLKDAEIKSLQAQVNPHFLFNAMNTISALIRVNSEQARELLLQMSLFLRSNLQGARQPVIPLRQELEQLDAFMNLEFARFPNRYTVKQMVGEGPEEILVPPFILQVLVENAFRHAFQSRKTGNLVNIQVRKEEKGIHLEVSDNGYGIEEGLFLLVGKETVPSEKGTGSALENLNKRLINLYGEKAALHFSSSKEGTSISCSIPIQRKGEEEYANPISG